MIFRTQLQVYCQRKEIEYEVQRLYLVMMGGMTLASTCVLHPNLLSLCWSLTLE